MQSLPYTDKRAVVPSSLQSVKGCLGPVTPSPNQKVWLPGRCGDFNFANKSLIIDPILVQPTRAPKAQKGIGGTHPLASWKSSTSYSPGLR